MSESDNEDTRDDIAHHGAEADVLKRLRVANTGLAPGDPRILQVVVNSVVSFLDFCLNVEPISGW
jgi:hypothetical protein